jgi:hypothetical protein
MSTGTMKDEALLNALKDTTESTYLKTHRMPMRLQQPQPLEFKKLTAKLRNNGKRLKHVGLEGRPTDSKLAFA